MTRNQTSCRRIRPISEFERAADQPHVTLVRECIDFLRHNKKWWLTPILLVLLAASFLMILGGTAAGPFIYTLF